MIAPTAFRLAKSRVRGRERRRERKKEFFSKVETLKYPMPWYPTNPLITS